MSRFFKMFGSGTVFAFVMRFFTRKSSLEGALFPPLKLPVTFRPYHKSDFNACVAIYREVELGRFPLDGLGQFANYLANENKAFIVVEFNSEIIGFGGIELAGNNSSTLVYGMVVPKFQRQRIGSTLVLLRIAQLEPHRLGNFVGIFAVKDSLSVYRRFGFRFLAYWKYKDGTLHPAAYICVDNSTLERIKSALKKRAIGIQGELKLNAPVSGPAKIPQE